MLLINEGGGNVPNTELKSRIRKEGLYMWQVASMIPNENGFILERGKLP